MAIRIYGPNQTAGISIPTTGKGRISSDGLEAYAQAMYPVAPDGTPVGGGLTYTDLSGTITLGGTAQVLRAADADGIEVTGSNPGAASLWINEFGGTAAPNAAGSAEILPGATFITRSRSAISIWGATTGQAFTAGAA